MKISAQICAPCAILLYLCAEIILKNDLDEKNFVDWSCNVDRFNSNFCRRLSNQYESECCFLTHDSPRRFHRC